MKTGRAPSRARQSIRFTGARAGEGRVEFDGIADDGDLHHFAIEADTLGRVALDCDMGLGLMNAYERHRPMIHGVATRLFGAGVRADPILLMARHFAGLPAA